MPAQHAVREEIQAGLTLDRDPSGQILIKGRTNGILPGTASVRSSGRGDHLLRTWIDAVLIGKDVDSESLVDLPRERGREAD